MNTLLIVDVQNDFCPGGALEVKEGDKVVPVINGLQKKFAFIIATQDWHPKGHLSFAASHGKTAGEVIKLDGLDQILWPDHCVQQSRGAEFHPGLAVERIRKVFQKGTDSRIDSYSGFFDNAHRKSTGLGDYLKEEGVKRVYVAGLATDYCVRYSALDAVELGFETYVIEDACRGVELKPGDVQRALEEMKKAGVKIIPSGEILRG